MARFRKQKTELLRLCASDDWKRALEALISTEETALEVVNPLLALLPRPEFVWRAAFGLGRAVAFMAKKNMESARVFMRRLMWSMNEESGNLGWGIPEAMGCILAESPALAAEYSRILISYGHDTGREDNFVDHAPLRRGVYWAIGRLAAANAAAASPALPHLVKALEDDDPGVQGMAAFALRQLAGHGPARGTAAGGTAGDGQAATGEPNAGGKQTVAPKQEPGGEHAAAHTPDAGPGQTAAQWEDAARALERAAARPTAATFSFAFFDGQEIRNASLAEVLTDARLAIQGMTG